MTIPTALDPIVKFSHPALMWVLFALTLYAMYLGFQIRRTRAAEGDTKKALIKGKFNVRHHQISSVMLAFMVLGTIGGMASTYVVNQKLFVGPHLLVGLSMTGMIAVSASLTPLLQKGSDLARNAHISLNVVLLGLFGWQAITGMQIVQKLLSN